MSAAAPVKPLKTRNLPWLCSLVVLDALVVAAIVIPAELPSGSPTTLAALRAAIAALLPLVVLLLAQLLPSPLKASLVFWRTKDALPGHRAFSVYAEADSRVNVLGLKKRIGKFPTTSRDQNTAWFNLYRQVAGEPSVIDANQGFLLFRDMAAISILLAGTAPVSLVAIGSSARVAWITAALFAVQYLLMAVVARNNGTALVKNVLALSAGSGQSKKR